MTSAQAVLAPAVESDNTGDLVIQEAVLHELPTLAPLVRYPTHRPLDRGERGRVAATTGLLPLLGTNILSSHVERSRQWWLTPGQVRALDGRVLGVGLGWWQYQGRPCSYSRWALRRVLTQDVPHSVRDRYTLRRLRQLGIPATYTGCPTMWQVPDGPRPSGVRDDGVVVTVTDYLRDPAADRQLLLTLSSHYREVVAWPQGNGDLAYLSELVAGTRVAVLERGLPALDEALRSRDYVGTRLHAGVRALQLGRQALVLAVDNRAWEMHLDSGLPVVRRGDPQALVDWLTGAAGQAWVNLPRREIAEWKARCGLAAPSPSPEAIDGVALDGVALDGVALDGVARGGHRR